MFIFFLLVSLAWQRPASCSPPYRDTDSVFKLQVLPHSPYLVDMERSAYYLFGRYKTPYVDVILGPKRK
jgi:hypothetical protein